MAPLAGNLKKVPFPNLIGIIDGNFVDICRPMGLDIFHANKDLQEFYITGRERHMV